MKLTRAWLLDASERVLATAIISFLSALLISTDVSFAAVSSAAVAGLAAALTVLKTLLASQIGDPNSASLFPSVGASAPPSVQNIVNLTVAATPTSTE